MTMIAKIFDKFCLIIVHWQRRMIGKDKTGWRKSEGRRGYRERERLKPISDHQKEANTRKGCILTKCNLASL